VRKTCFALASLLLAALCLTPLAPTEPRTAHAAVKTNANPNEGVVFTSGPPIAKRVAISFDDGPDLVYTPQILDVLKREHVKATFFLLGRHARKYPGMVKRIVEEGHSVGNHTWDHPQLPKVSSKQIRAEIQRTDSLLFHLIGYHTFMFRPPYGAASSANISQISRMHYKVIDWSVDTRDWSSSSPAQILDVVNRTVKPGSIILEHSAGPKALQNTVDSLPQMIRWLREQHYEIVTIPELLKIKTEYE
jgi:peptidoglycan-N-acetylglucosamine deacetylase